MPQTVADRRWFVERALAHEDQSIGALKKELGEECLDLILLDSVDELYDLLSVSDRPDKRAN